MRDAARELHDLETPLHLPARVGEHLAMFVHDETCKIIRVLTYELAKGKENSRALVEARAAPAFESIQCRGDGSVDVRRGRERNLGGRFASRRIVNRAGAIGAAVVAHAGDPVVETEHIGLFCVWPALSTRLVYVGAGAAGYVGGYR